MPVLKLYAKGVNRQPDGKPEAAAMKVLQSVITRRIDADLLEDGIVEKIALSSGGVLRDVVRIAQRCCSEVLVKLRRMKRQKQSIDHVRIDQDILQESLDKLRNDIQLGLSKTDREILVQVYNQFIPENPKEEAFLILLHTVVVIEYRNRESWYDVHPLIMEQLKIEKLIP
ncbi:MAG: hypothetical protein ACK5RE_17020 [Pseudanabaena sp.]|jgi:hypothetical protein